MKTVATEFRKEFRAAPVPIQLSTPFSKKVNLNYHARAVSCTNRTLLVHSVSPFERGIQLTVAAPFLEGRPECRVVGVKRNPSENTGYEVELQFAEPPVLVATVDGGPAPSPRKTPPPARETPLLTADIAAAASGLAAALETSAGIPFARAFSQIQSPDRHLRLLATIAATLLLLEEKGFADGSLAAMPARPDS